MTQLPGNTAHGQQAIASPRICPLLAHKILWKGGDPEHNRLVHAHDDGARPGTATVGRDGLENLLYLARQEPRPVDGILFWSFSRPARRQLDAQIIRSDLRRRGYVLHSMTDDIPYGVFSPVVKTLIDWTKERFLMDLSKDVKRGLYDLARAG